MSAATLLAAICLTLAAAERYFVDRYDAWMRDHLGFLLAEEAPPLQAGAKSGSVVKPQESQVSQESGSASQESGVRRRSGLTNDITGTTPPRRPTPRNDAERFKAAIAAYEAAHRR